MAAACRELSVRMRRIGARLLQVDEADVNLADGCVVGAGGSVTIAEIGRTWYLKPQDMPDDVDAGEDGVVGCRLAIFVQPNHCVL